MDATLEYMKGAANILRSRAQWKHDLALLYTSRNEPAVAAVYTSQEACYSDAAGLVEDFVKRAAFIPLGGDEIPF